MELCNYPSLEATRFYEIEAIQIPIVYNKYGDHDPDGILYVLKKTRTESGKVRYATILKQYPSPMKRLNRLSSERMLVKKL